MKIIAINALEGQREMLCADRERRLAAYVDRVIEPLRPFWAGAPWFRRGQGADAAEPTPEEVTRMYSFYGPDLDAEAGLRALDDLDRADAWRSSVAALETAIDALRPGERGVSIEEVRFTFVLADPARMDERLDMYTGWGGIPGLVMLLAWPTSHNLPRLPPIVSHEFNHNVRFSIEPWTPQTTVGQYIVAEGLAEAFAAELYGEEMLGRWATTLRGAELDALRPRFLEALHVTGFDEIRGYVFGDWAAGQSGYKPQGLPDFAGYAMGYRLVRAFLERTGMTAAEATYVPWPEIVERSGFLQ